MKFSVITLTCLASFAATAYSHLGTNVLEQRDDDTFKSALKLAWSDLGAAEQAVYDYNGEDSYEFPQAAKTARDHLYRSEQEVKASSALSEAGAADIKLLFQDLGTASKSLHTEFIAKKRTIEANSKCKDSHDYVQVIWLFSNALVKAIVDNSDPKVKDLIRGYAGDYIYNLRLAILELERPKCVNGDSQ